MPARGEAWRRKQWALAQMFEAKGRVDQARAIYRAIWQDAKLEAAQ